MHEQRAHIHATRQKEQTISPANFNWVSTLMCSFKLQPNRDVRASNPSFRGHFFVVIAHHNNGRRRQQRGPIISQSTLFFWLVLDRERKGEKKGEKIFPLPSLSLTPLSFSPHLAPPPRATTSNSLNWTASCRSCAMPSTDPSPFSALAAPTGSEEAARLGDPHLDPDAQQQEAEPALSGHNSGVHSSRQDAASGSAGPHRGGSAAGRSLGQQTF